MSRGRLFFSVRLERLADNAYVVDRVRERAKPALVILVADEQATRFSARTADGRSTVDN